MLNAEFLLDDFHRSGSNATDFETLLKEIDYHTCYQVVSMKSLVVFSALDPKYQTKAPAECIARVFAPGNPWVKDVDSRPPVNRFRTQNLLPGVRSTEEYDKKLYTEMVTSNSMMLSIVENGKGNLYHVSQMALPTLAQRLGITSKAIAERSFPADSLVAQLLNQSKEVKLVVKHYRRVGKICAVMSPKYVEVPLQDICIIYRDLFGFNPQITKINDTTPIEIDNRNVICEGWDITHQRVRISFSFPGYAEELNTMYNIKDKLIPCLELVTSDVGENSFEAVGYWKTPAGTKIYDAHYKREHRGAAVGGEEDEDLSKKKKSSRKKSKTPEKKSESLRTVIRKGIEESIFHKYTILPERLLDLMQVDITPEGEDLLSAQSRGRNRNAVYQAYKYAFKHLGLVGIISKKRVSKILAQIDYAIQEDMHYTAYDIVMYIFDMERSLKPWLDKDGVCEETIRKFGEAVSKAAYIDFENLKPKEKKTRKETEAFFMPAL